MSFEDFGQRQILVGVSDFGAVKFNMVYGIGLVLDSPQVDSWNRLVLGPRHLLSWLRFVTVHSRRKAASAPVSIVFKLALVGIHQKLGLSRIQ